MSAGCQSAQAAFFEVFKLLMGLDSSMEFHITSTGIPYMPEMPPLRAPLYAAGLIGLVFRIPSFHAGMFEVVHAIESGAWQAPLSG